MSGIESFTPPLVDVLLPTFNGEKYLPDLLSSISKQSYKNFRLIGCDDASSDRSFNILKECDLFLKNQFYFLRNDENLGVVVNVKNLLENSVASYNMFADQDDFWLDDKIAKSLKKIQEAEGFFGTCTPIVVFTDSYIGDENLIKQSESLLKRNGYFGYSPKSSIERFKGLMVQNIASGCTMIINRALKERLKLMPEKAIMHDWWVMLAASAMGKVICLSDKTMVYREHKNNTLGLRPLSFFLATLNIIVNPLEAKRRIEMTYKQAEIFRDTYFEFLSEDVKYLLNEYISLSHHGFSQRCRVLWRNEFKKSSVSKTIGFYLLS